MTKNSTKRALVASLLSLLLCCAMLVGTTLAWFTDSVTSGKNQIVAGNLDVNLQYKDASGSWTDVKSTTDLFHPVEGSATLWEPGHVEVVNLKISNTGTLALQYILDISIANEIGSINAEGNPFKLSDYIQFAVVDGDKTYTGDAAGREQAIKDAEAAGATVLATLPANESGILPPRESDDSSKYVTLIAYMPTSVGNEANHRTGEAVPTIELGVELFATQAPYESDSFDENYDADALVKVGTIQELTEAIAAAQANDVIMLSENILEPLTLAIDKNITLFMNSKHLTVVNVALSNAASLTLVSGNTDAVTVNGEGTLVLKNMRITATSENASAVALGESANVAVVAEGSNTLIGAKNGDGIRVPETASLNLSGSGSLTAKGNAAQEGNGGYGSGICADGALLIDRLAGLIAEGYGNSGFGVGGSTTELVIKNTTVQYARGGNASSQPVAGDESYVKSGEGKPAIGIDVPGTVTLENVTVKKAEGGFKSAAIGGWYHHAVTVNISGCTINDVVGGASAAAIGGGRATNNTDDKVEIYIADSQITNAQGGYFGAGIGSGYDTNCSGLPSVHIEITASTVTAKGGKYAAGIGTGYHVGKLTGSIDQDSVIDASAPDIDFYKDSYTTAQAIGYGVMDPNREFKNPSVTFTVKGTVIDTPKSGN